MGSCCGKPEADFSRHKTCRRPSAEKVGGKIDLTEGAISIEPGCVIYRPAVEHRDIAPESQLQTNGGPTTNLCPYAEQRYKDGLEYARKATQYDQQGHFSGAVAFYNEAVEALSQACTMAPVHAPYMDQLMDYRRRAEEIRQYLSTTKAKPPAPAASGQNLEKDKHYMHQIEYLLDMARQDDKQGERSQAQNLYSCAIQLALKAQKSMTSEADKQWLKTITMEAMNRLEELKLEPESSLDLSLDNMTATPEEAPQEESQPTPAKGAPAKRRQPSRGQLTGFLDAGRDLATPPKPNLYCSGFSKLSSFSSTTFDVLLNNMPVPPKELPQEECQPHQTRRKKAVKLAVMCSEKNDVTSLKPNIISSDQFTKKELKVLRATSEINGVTYPPWNNADLSEFRSVSALSEDYEDPMGVISLSSEQKTRLGGWMRPHEICDHPKMIHLISSLTIKQGYAGDSSFIASLAVSADYEKRFKTRLITRCIYPQNWSGEPIINPGGKYLVRLNLNGTRRKVTIDDRLPVGHHGEPLCSHSSNCDEFWISLIEKAYMKVMGGYDFPGSSSNIDLHALTGWIPEQITMKDADVATFKKMEQSLHRGDALLTVATGFISDAQAEREGLVPTCVYAILNVVEIKGFMLLQLKNPWSHRKWKGNFSENDNTHWTPELRRALNFDQNKSLQVDSGVFWIDWKSLQKCYDVIYINWKPDMFRHKSILHDIWEPTSVIKDVYDISNNPQYSLKVSSTDQAATVWVLLSRHITTKSDFANNKKFITLFIAKSNGKRKYLPENFLVQGVKINTPHYLAKLEQVPRGTSTYTVIVSQLESLTTIYYTLRVYSTCEFVLTPVPDPYTHSEQLQGDWSPGQKEPPRFKYTNCFPKSQVMVKLHAPKELVVRLEMVAESQETDFKKVDSGPLRPGFTVLETSGVPKGTFAVIPFTWSQLPPKPVPFFITLYSDNAFNFT